MFTALFTAYCPLLSSIQPRLLRKESSKKQSVVSAKVHLVEVKVPVHMTWKTISMYMPIWRKYFYFFFQLFELQLRRPYTLFKLIKPSFWLLDTYLDSSNKHSISRSDLPRAQNYFMFSRHIIYLWTQAQ